LCHVRQRFDEVISQEDTMLELKGMAFPQDPESQACRKLRLEDMKWAFEEIVKPHTERFGKDLFLCRVCDANQKLFSFEAVIQHFAAKHTSELSHGNAVVYWKADWPLEPPFDPSPNIPWVREGDNAFSRFDAGSKSSSQAGSSSKGAAVSSAETYGNHVREIAMLALDFWQRTEGIWDLSNPVRLYIIIHHINRRFQKTFGHQLRLPLLMDVVSARAELLPLRNLTSLRCKICSEASRETPSRRGQLGESSYSFSTLTTHFQQMHINPQTPIVDLGWPPLASGPNIPSRGPDWWREMILLPSAAAIRALPHSTGINQGNLQLITDAFPDEFASPEPLLGPSLRPAKPFQPMVLRDPPFVEHIRAPSGNGSVRGSGAESYIAYSEISENPLDNEYDPHRPGPAFRHRLPHEARYDPHPHARETTRYIPVQHARAMPSGGQEYFLRDAGSSHLYEVRGRDAPLSRDSVAYSYEDGSSRRSYRELPTKYSETTVGDGSDARPQSKATSWHSLALGTEPGARPVSVSTGGQHAVDEEGASSAAVDFLNNFDPMSEAAMPEAHSSGAASVGYTIGPAHSGMNQSTAVGDLPLEVRSPHASVDDHPDSRTSFHRRHTPALPIREVSRAGFTDVDRHGRHGYGPGLSHENPRRPTVGPDYAEGLPERLHPGRYGTDVRDMQEIPMDYSTHRYHPSGSYYEDEYGQRGGRYETTEQIPDGREVYRMDDAGVRYVEVGNLHGHRYVDDIPYEDRDYRPREYVRRAPEDYQAGADGYALNRRSDMPGYSRSVVYTRGETIPPRIQGAVDEHREIVYDSISHPTRYPPC
jgi:hypothetical protein